MPTKFSRPTTFPTVSAGLLATEEFSQGARLGQIPILGTLEDVADIAKTYRATDVLVVADTLPGSRLRKLMQTCEREGLTLKIIRPLFDRLEGDNHVPIRDIEISDLLGRDPVTLDTENIGELLEGRRVMITGAGGSIGSEICRQVAPIPSRIADSGRPRREPHLCHRKGTSRVARHGLAASLHRRHHQSSANGANLSGTPSGRRLSRGRAQARSADGSERRRGGRRNNVFGTKCLADLADECGVSNFVMISTDKAVRPTSVMGVTKQIAERYVHTFSQESATRFSVVRFGNVLAARPAALCRFFRSRFATAAPSPSPIRA